jgi:S1-C subfamily serine protease
VKAQFRFLSGARAGQIEIFSKAYIGIGRHPLSDVRFDAERDLDVSSRHAAVVRKPDGYVLQDLGSRNGTYVNGQRISGDTVLNEGDAIGFGVKGPALEFRLIDAAAEPLPTTAAEQAAVRVSAPREQFEAVAPAAHPRRSSTTMRIREEVARQTRSLRTKVLLALLGISVVAFTWVQWSDARAARQVAELQHRADSLRTQMTQLLGQFQNQMQSVRDALRESQTEVARLRSALVTAGTTGDAAEIRRLRAQLDRAEARQRGLVGAAGVDYRALAQHNQDAVAMVLVRFGSDDSYSGTAFAVDSQGTLVTNKHVLVGEEGDRTPQEIAVKFSGSKQWFRGRLVGVAPDADIGILKVDIRGGTPRVQGLERDIRSLERGDPVAILGYPLGFDLPMRGEGLYAVAEPSLTVGTASKVLPNVVQVDGYGAPGSSGSPIFNREGRVVAVLYGGQTESNGKIIFAVPVQYALSYLQQIHVSVP